MAQLEGTHCVYARPCILSLAPHVPLSPVSLSMAVCTLPKQSNSVSTVSALKIRSTSCRVVTGSPNSSYSKRIIPIKIKNKTYIESHTYDLSMMYFRVCFLTKSEIRQKHLCLTIIHLLDTFLNILSGKKNILRSDIPKKE